MYVSMIYLRDLYIFVTFICFVLHYVYPVVQPLRGYLKLLTSYSRHPDHL